MPFFERGDVRIHYEEVGCGSTAGHPRAQGYGIVSGTMSDCLTASAWAASASSFLSRAISTLP